MGIFSKKSFNRDELERSEKQILVQADIYFPSEYMAIPKLSIIATEKMKATNPSPANFYRLGITNQGLIYFAYAAQDAAGPKLYKQDRKTAQLIGRPSWQRFSMILEGSKKIRCYINNRELSFSPIEEDSLKEIQFGVFLSDPEVSYSCYVDNFSILSLPNRRRTSFCPLISFLEAAPKNKI